MLFVLGVVWVWVVVVVWVVDCFRFCCCCWVVFILGSGCGVVCGLDIGCC